MTSHHDVAGVVAELRDRSDHYLPDWARCAMGTAAGLLESQAKALSEAEANLALLSDPSSVHINMCRGTIAKPSWENLRHLFPVIYDLEHAERRRLAAEARLAELSRAMTEVRDWLILAGDMTCREIPLGIIARAQQESKDA